MPRPYKIDRPRPTEVQIPGSIYNKMMTELHSEIEDRVPHGAVSELVTRLITDWLKNERGVVV